MSNGDFTTDPAASSLDAALTGAERYLGERMRDPHYAAAYVKALHDMRMEETDLHAFRLSSGQVCYLYLPPRLTRYDVDRMRRFLMLLAVPAADDAGERG